MGHDSWQIKSFSQISIDNKIFFIENEILEIPDF